MQEFSEVIFQKQPASFLKRFWQVYSANFLIALIVALIPCLFLKEINAIVILWFVIIAATLLSGLYNTYKWSLRKISAVAYNNDVFTITVITRNAVQHHHIAKNDIATKLKWQSGKLKILTLTIFDKKNKVTNVYSARKKDEYDLENIAYQIDKKLKT